MANVGFVSDFWDQSSHELLRGLHGSSAPSAPGFVAEMCKRHCHRPASQVDMPATVLHPHVNRWFLPSSSVDTRLVCSSLVARLLLAYNLLMLSILASSRPRSRQTRWLCVSECE